MGINYPFLQSLVKILFIAIIPSIIIYYRIRGKIQTGTTAGLVVSSFFIGLILSATLHENPARRFEQLLNEKKMDEARRCLKGIVQGGPEAIARIDAGHLINPGQYDSMRKDLITEYHGIAERYIADYASRAGRIDDSDREAIRKKMEHGLLR